MTVERDLPDGPCHLRATYRPISITGDMPDTRTGETVAFEYTVTAVNTPAVCVIESGALPLGLSMDETGAVTGECVASGVYEWTVKASDTLGYMARCDDTCVVTGIEITGHLPQGYVGSLIPVSYQYTVTGGVLPRSVSLVSGALPTGLSVDSSGLVTGYFTEVGSFTWALQAEDNAGETATVSQSMDVIAITPLDPDTLANHPSSTGGTISDDNLTLTKIHDSNGFSVGARAPISSAKTAGKYYIEITVLVVPNPSGNTTFGVFGKDELPPSAVTSVDSALCIFGNGAGYLNSNVFASGGPSFMTANATVGLAIDAGTGEVWWRNASGWNAGGNPAAGENPFKTINATYRSGGLIPFANTYSNDGSCRVNFGQEAFKLGDVPAGFLADGRRKWTA